MESKECEDTFLNLVERINKCDEMLSHMYCAYHQQREALLRLDAEIMTIYKKKIILEKRLIAIQKCKPYNGPRRKKSIESQEASLPLLSKLNPKQLDELLAVLTEVKK